MRWFAMLLLGLITALHGVRVQGGEYAWYVLKRDFRRNNCWPKPFPPAARDAVRQPFYNMIDNGWRQQNLISQYHFNNETNLLTEAGKVKVRSIITELPQARRVLFVQRDANSDVTLARVDAVQQEASRVAGSGPLPQVLETSITPKGTPAHYVDAVDTRYLEGLPSPHLTPIDTSSSQSDSGS